MSQDYEPSAELHQLLQATAEGELDEASSVRLGEIVRQDAKARAFYVDYMSVHALLGWRHGAVPPLEMPLNVPGTKEHSRTATGQRPALWITAALLLIAAVAAVFAFGPRADNSSQQQPLAVIVEEDDAKLTDGTRLNLNESLPAGRHQLAAGEAVVKESFTESLVEPGIGRLDAVVGENRPAATVLGKVASQFILQKQDIATRVIENASPLKKSA